MSERPEEIETTRTDPKEILQRLRTSGRGGDGEARPGAGARVSRYHVVGEIARGGMGVILKVRDPEMRRSLAMKVLRDASGDRDFPDDTRARRAGSSLESQREARFLEEAQVTGQLEHPGIVPVHEVGLDDDDRLFFTMRLVRGVTLDDVFAHARAGEEGWTLTRALGAILKVCEAMAFAHDRGVIHRDLKPANVMVGRFGETYVMDWGLSKILGQEDTKDIRLAEAPAQTVLTSTRKDEAEEGDSPLTTLDGDVIGTPSYMAPEQAMGRVDEVGPAADVYSVGAMLYHLLAGHPPYVPAAARVPVLAVLNALLAGPPPPVESRDVPGELVAICEKAMAREPQRRYASMLALADDLQAFIENRVVQAYETGAVAEFRKWIGRNRGMAASLAAAIVLGFGGLAAVTFVQTRARSELTAANDELRVTNEALEVARSTAEENATRAREQEAEARLQSYVANITAAGASLDRGAAADAEARLAACAEEHRGWEWRFFQNRADASLMTLEGSTESFVLAAAYSPDGRHFASSAGNFAQMGGRDFAIRVWSPEGELRHVLEGHTQAVVDVGFSPAGTELASGDAGGTVHVWDVESGEIVATRRSTGPILDYHPDGLRIATVSFEGTVDLWNILTDERVRESFPGRMRSVAFSSDGTRLAVGSGDYRVRVLEVPSLGLLREIDLSAGLRPFENPWLQGVIDVRFDAAGDELLVALDNGDVRALDPESGRMRILLDGHEGTVNAVRYSPDGRHVVSAGSDSTIRFWDVETGELLEVLQGHDAPVLALALSPNGDRIVSGALDRTVRVWDGQPGSSVTTLRGSGHQLFSDNDAVFGADGVKLAWLDDGTRVHVTDARTGEDLFLLPDLLFPVRGIAFSVDGERLWTVGGGDPVRVWDAATGELEEVVGERLPVMGSAAFSPDRSRFAARLVGETRVGLWSTATGALERQWELTCDAMETCFSPDGGRLAGGLTDGRVVLWDVESGAQQATTSLPGPAFRVRFAPDGRRIAAITYDSWEKQLWIWELDTGELRPLRGHEQPASLDFSPDGTRVATGNWDDTVSLWDPDLGEVASLRGHRGVVTALAFAPGGLRFASCAVGGHYRIWETTTVQERSDVRRAAARRRVLERQARPLVDRLLERAILPSEAVEWLEADGTLSAELREAAVRLARTTPYDLARFWGRAGVVLVDPDRSPDEYLRALRATEFFQQIFYDPGTDVRLLFFLGLAQYRMGRFDEALATTARARGVHGDTGWPPPGDAIVAALCEIERGNLDEARALLAKVGPALRGASTTGETADYVIGVRQLLDEAERRLAAAR